MHRLKKTAEFHGKTNTRLYRIYTKMKERCYSRHDISFYLYGGRGVEICEERLESFEAFYEWAINHGYSEDLSIDRIDTNGNYEPSNCRWASPTEQVRNRRNALTLTIRDEKLPIAEWCERAGLGYHRVYRWLQKDGEYITSERIIKALDGKLPPSLCQKSIIFKSQRYESLKALADAYGIPYQVFHQRLSHGWSMEEAVGVKEHQRIARRKGGSPVCPIQAIKDDEVRLFESITEAANYFNVHRSHISHVLNDDRQRVRGYSLKWKED